jgi:hypothetical protein
MTAIHSGIIESAGDFHGKIRKTFFSVAKVRPQVIVKIDSSHKAPLIRSGI